MIVYTRLIPVLYAHSSDPNRPVHMQRVDYDQNGNAHRTPSTLCGVRKTVPVKTVEKRSRITCKTCLKRGFPLNSELQPPETAWAQAGDSTDLHGVRQEWEDTVTFAREPGACAPRIRRLTEAGDALLKALNNLEGDA